MRSREFFPKRPGKQWLLQSAPTKVSILNRGLFLFYYLSVIFLYFDRLCKFQNTIYMKHTGNGITFQASYSFSYHRMTSQTQQVNGKQMQLTLSFFEECINSWLPENINNKTLEPIVQPIAHISYFRSIVCNEVRLPLMFNGSLLCGWGSTPGEISSFLKHGLITALHVF